MSERLQTRKACRSGIRCEPTDLALVPLPEQFKENLHCGVGHCDAGFEGVARVLEIQQKTLSDMCNVSEPDWLPIKRLPLVAKASADNPMIAHFFARLQNGTFVPNIVIANDADRALFDASAAVMKELSEAVDAIRDSLRGDNRITKDELPNIDAQIDDIVRTALQLKSVVHLVADVGPSSPIQLRRTR